MANQKVKFVKNYMGESGVRKKGDVITVSDKDFDRLKSQGAVVIYREEKKEPVK